MSYVLSIYAGDSPATFEDAIDALLEKDSAFDSGEPPGPEIGRFVADLLERWPCITTDDGADSPWADGPMINNAAGDAMHFSMSYSRVEEATAFAAELARSHRLVLVDQEHGLVLVPAGVAPRADDQPDLDTKRRRWWRR